LSTFSPPIQRSLIRLFEEDTYNLRNWGHEVSAAIDQWCFAQKLALEATSKLAATVMSYSDQKFPLDETAYDIPTITNRVAQTFTEINGWMEIFLQQIECCVQYPIRKINAELDELVEHLRPNVADAFSNLAEAEDKFLRMGKKDAPRKLEEANNDVFISKMSYHKLALQYCSRMNALQTNRYMQFIEPMLALLYAFKSLFNVGHDAFRNEHLTSFLTQAQQQMQDIDKNSEADRKKSTELLTKLSELSKSEHELYYGENTSSDQCKIADGVQKHGYLRIKLKSGLFLSNWEKYFVFTQGASLMWQKPDQLVGTLMLDFSTTPGCSAEVAGDQTERRFVFAVNVPATGEGRGEGDRKWFLQARNTADMHQWVEVINNLAGSQHKTQLPAEVAEDVQQRISTEKKSFESETHSINIAALTPSNTPVYELSKLALMRQPIEFDLLSLCASPVTDFKVADLAQDACNFDVRFLGCIEILSDQGGDAAIQPAIERVLDARTAHSISDSTACTMVISRRLMCVALLNHENNDDIKAYFALSDVVCWTTHSNERIFALVTKCAADKGPLNRPSFKCSVLSTDDTADASDVCKVLESVTRESLNSMLLKKSTIDDESEDLSVKKTAGSDTGGEKSENDSKGS
ncbi:unnamed protein product, partial [Enterobius vermicularis]|uniref:PH domain-containing protein n=1 Tax=Enterobius vermicularis TaxID=51028 RepID=A0A0N4V857_ENTVE